MKALWVLVGWSLTLGAAPEIQTVVKPAWTVVLKDRMQLRPGMAARFGERIVFSEWKGRQDCLGQDLYSFSLRDSGREVSRLAEVSCVNGITVENGALWVATDKAVRQLDGNGKWVTDPSAPGNATVAEHRSRLEFSLALAGLDSKSTVQSEKPRFLSGYWFFQDDLGALRFVDLMGQSRLPYPVKAESASIRGARRVWMHSSRNYLFVERAAGSFTQWLAFPLKAPGSPVAIGKSQPMGRRNEAPLSEVAFRDPRFVQPTEEGLLVWEGSDHVRDNRGLFFLSMTDRTARRVWIPNDRYLTGVQFVDGGILVSQARPAQVRWYGSDTAKTVFDRHLGSAEWERNSMVPVVGGNDE